MIGIAKYLIKKPLVTNLIIVFILILSVASIFRIQRQGYPRVDFQKMKITTVYPGASPEDVELNVTIKLEEALKEITGIDKYTSRSQENLSTIEINIDINAEDTEKVKDDIRRAIEGVTDLPEDVKDKPYIFELKFDNFEIYELVLTNPDNNETELIKHGKDLKRMLLDIDEVSRIYEDIKTREIKILLDPRKMSENELSFEDVINSIKYNKIRISGGSVESFTSKKNIVTISEFENIKDVGNIIIRSNFSGYRVRIKDIAKIVDSFEDEHTLLRFNGQRGISFNIAKKGPADIIKTVDKINEVVEKYRKKTESTGLKIFSTRDDSIETKNRLSIVSSNAIAGFILVIITLFIFLDTKTAIWTAIGIPISVGLTLIFIPFFDITLNSISLCGMVVVLGMIVDDAIIIAESISKEKERGLSSSEAAINGLKIVIKPVIGTIITTMIAFLPIYFIPGMIGQFAVEIPSIVILMLAASFIEATTILPAHLAHGDKDDNKPVRVPPGQKLFDKLGVLYKKFLTLMLKHRYISLACCLAFLLIGGGVSLVITKFKMFPEDQAYKLFIYGNTKEDSTLEFNAEETLHIEKVIESLPDGIVHSYKSYIGVDFNKGMSSIQSTNSFLILLLLTPATERNMTALEVKDYITEKFSKVKNTYIKKLNYWVDSGGPPVGKPLEIQVIGNDNIKRKKAINEIMKDLAVLGFTEIDSDIRDGKDELRLLPDYEKIAAANLNVASIASTVRTAYDGEIVTHLQTADEKIPFRVMLDKKYRNNNNPLKGLKARNMTGSLVNIESMVKIKKAYSTQNIFHNDSYRTNTITANIDFNKITPSEANSLLNEKYKNFNDNHPGLSLKMGGEAEESSKTMIRLMIAIAAAVTAIYFILVIQFNSFSLPFMVIMTVPFGVVGITVAFGLHGLNLSMLALVGVLGFAGVAVNDSLVMVEFINRLRENGEEDKATNDEDEDEILSTNKFNRAVIDGAGLRLRPILLTTLTTTAGLIPTAYGIIGGIDSFISPMVMAMTWGLFIGTTSVLIVIPLFYSVNNDIYNFFQKKVLRRK